MCLIRSYTICFCEKIFVLMMPVHNSDITENFNKMADLLEIEGANPFRVRAYRDAARTIGGLSRNGLMYRYRNEDDFGKPQSSFTVCTFWLIKVLYKTGEKEKAEKMFQKVLSYRNHVGLLSEDIDFETKRLLGNFPQGYSHIALIDSAITLCGECVTDQPHEFREIRGG